MESFAFNTDLPIKPKRKSYCPKKITQKSSHYFGIKTYQQIKIGSNMTSFIPAIPLCKTQFFALHKIPRFYFVRSPNPYCAFKAYKKLKNYAILGVGANCGECLVTFWKLFYKLKNKNAIISISSILKNPAFGYTAQADFYNAILWIKTRLGYVDFWSLCAYLERSFGRNRKRPFKNAPRTLDIDIIGFKNQYLKFKHLQIPHIAWSQRLSVRIPLLERRV